MKMSNQSLRNFTTGLLHTSITEVYVAIEALTGVSCMTHQIPELMLIIKPHLQQQLTDERFWDGKFDTTHTGESEVTPMDPPLG